MINPIEKAVAPLKKDAMERARQDAEDAVQRTRDELAVVGWDINKSAPYPTGYGISLYINLERYTRHHSLTESDPALGWQSANPNSPRIVVINEERVQRYIKNQVTEAGLAYDAFVRKLVTKIGEAKSAKLQGNHVWDFSILLVTKKDGTQEAWKTQRIVNYSKLGKAFNQWPTKKMIKLPEGLAA